MNTTNEERLQELVSSLDDENALGHAREVLEHLETAETVETLSDFVANVGDALDAAHLLVRALEVIKRNCPAA